MDFVKEFIFFAGSRLIGVLVTVVAAVIFRSYWALVAGMVATRAASLALSYAMVVYRPCFDLSATRELISFSRWLLGHNAMILAVVRFPHFLIGRVMGAQQLGLFTMAYEFATLPATELSSPVNRAAFPGYSRMLDDKVKFKEAFLDIGALVVLVALPASAGLAVVSDPLVRVVLGEKWLGAVPIFSILATSAAFVAVSGNNGVAHLALGYPRAVAFQTFLRLFVLVVLGLALAPVYGIVGVAVAELCGATVNLVASYPIVFRQLNVKSMEYAARVARPVAATALMVVIVRITDDWLFLGQDVVSDFLRLFIGIGVGAVAYSMLILLMWSSCGKPEGAERILIGKMKGVVRRIA